MVKNALPWKLFAAALGSELDLCAAEAAILRVVAVGQNLYVIDGIFRGGDDRGFAPHGAGGADTVDG